MATGLDSAEAMFAAEVVREAARLVRCVQRDMIGGPITKLDMSPVTVADFAAQALVASRLRVKFRDAPLVGEEDAGSLRTDEGRHVLEEIVGFVARHIPDADCDAVCEWIDAGAVEPGTAFWTLDPVDGTKGFLRGGQYAIALALVDDGQVEVGALGCPELQDGLNPSPGGAGSLLVAVRGGGAWTQPLESETATWRPLEVSRIGEPSRARVLRSVEKSHTDADGITRLGDVLEIGGVPIEMDSQAKYAVLAAGGGEIVLRLLSPLRPDYREKIWDQAAGSIIVEEGGGRVTDLDGRDLDFSRGRTLSANRGVLATNGRLHDAVLRGLRAVGA